MADRDEARRFEQSLLGWLDDAYNLARWLLRDDQDAQDAVQDAFMRAARYAGGFSHVHAHDLQSNRMLRFYYAQTVPGEYHATVDDQSLFDNFCTMEALERSQVRN